MHELSIVLHAIKTVKEVAIENKVSSVSSVTIELGEVSAVIPHYFTDMWDWAVKREPIMENAKLVLETLPAVTICEDCEKTYETVTYGKTCPHCGSEHTYLLTGNEINIKEIAVE